MVTNQTPAEKAEEKTLTAITDAVESAVEHQGAKIADVVREGAQDISNTLIFATLRHAFVARLCEWQSAVILTLFGYVLLLPPTLFTSNPSYAGFGLLVEESTLGWMLICVGVVRVGVLAANGSWWPMYHVRALTALVSAVFWATISIGFLAGGSVNTWAAVYPVLFIFDALNVLRASADAAVNDRVCSGRKGNGR